MTNIIFAVLLSAVAMVESSNDPLKNNSKENAVGLLQIRRLAMIDLNQHYGTNYALADFYNPKLARWAFVHYTSLYGAATFEDRCRCWNSGSKWKRKKHLTDGYWRKVQRELAKLDR